MANKGAASDGGAGVIVFHETKKPPWDPLNSPDWDKESHSKDALLRIKRFVSF